MSVLEPVATLQGRTPARTRRALTSPALPTRERRRKHVVGSPQADDAVWHAPHGHRVCERARHHGGLGAGGAAAEDAQAAVALGCREAGRENRGQGGGRVFTWWWAQEAARRSGCRRSPRQQPAASTSSLCRCWDPSPTTSPAATSPDHRRTVPSAAALTNSSARSRPVRGLPGAPSAAAAASPLGASGAPMGLMPEKRGQGDALRAPSLWQLITCKQSRTHACSNARVQERMRARMQAGRHAPAMTAAVGLRGLPGETSAARSGGLMGTEIPERERMSSVCPASVRRHTSVSTSQTRIRWSRPPLHATRVERRQVRGK